MLAKRIFGMRCIAFFNAWVSLATYWQGSTVFRVMVTRSDSKTTDRLNLFQEPHRGLGDASGGRLLAPGIGPMAPAGTRMGGACHPSSPPSGDRHGIPGGIQPGSWLPWPQRDRDHLMTWGAEDKLPPTLYQTGHPVESRWHGTGDILRKWESSIPPDESPIVQANFRAE